MRSVMSRIPVWSLALFLFVVTGAAAMAPETPSSGAVDAEIKARIEGLQAGRLDGETVRADDLRRVYRAFGYQPLWVLGPAAEQRDRALEAALGDADGHGIDVRDLHQESRRRLATASTAPDIAVRDIILTDSFLRYALKLRQGTGEDVADWGIRPSSFDAASALIDAIRSDGVDWLLGSLAPPDPGYRRLTEALRAYREIAARGGWARLPDDREIKLDSVDPRLSALRRRLEMEGDLPEAASGDASVSDIAAALRRFQQRHGLAVDARAGAKTLAELNVSVEQRIAQIGANLERWRRLPHQFGDPYVAVNVADASLDFFQGAAPALHMKVIVGDLRHPTPVFAASIVAVTVNPPWNVPSSIAVKEILPRLKRNPGYLAANNMVILNGSADDPFGSRIDWRQLSPRNFSFRFRQLPGPKNSLGQLKFEMPNRFDVYLHDTPARALFDRPQRNFSHGCVRLEHAAALAEVLLAKAPDWDGGSVAGAMAEGETRTFPLSAAVPVYLLYWTAFVDAAGQINFRNDAYGRDPQLWRSLGMSGGAPTRLAAAPASNRGCPAS